MCSQGYLFNEVLRLIKPNRSVSYLGTWTLHFSVQADSKIKSVNFKVNGKKNYTYFVALQPFPQIRSEGVIAGPHPCTRNIIDVGPPQLVGHMTSSSQ